MNTQSQDPIEVDNDDHNPETGGNDVDGEEVAEVTTPVVVPERKTIKVSSTGRVAAIQPTRVFAIFEKPKLDPPLPEPIEIPDSPATEVIDVSSEEPNSPIIAMNSLSNQHTPPTGSSQDDPIVLDTSPIKPSGTSASTMWFTSTRKSAARPTSSRKEKQRSDEGTRVPFPAEYAQHIRGPQSQFATSAIPFIRRQQDSDLHIEYSTDRPLSEILSRPPRERPIGEQDREFDTHPGDDSEYIGTIPRLHQRYPAVARSLLWARERSTREHTTAHQEAWAEKWRPRRADEVIGNEERALYLRDWLSALRIQMATGTGEAEPQPKKTKKRKSAKNRKPEVVRHVNKKRKMNDGLAGFLASDDDDDDPPVDVMFGPDDDDFEFCQQTQDTLYSSATTPDGSQYSSALSELEDDPEDTNDSLPFPYSPPDFGTRIHNTILLAGPSGCGKTAAVHACAEEMGWEVFEVYPGIGERSGPELNKLIGDIGKNHIVRSALRRSPVRQHGYFAPKPGRKTVIRIDSDEEGEVDVVTSGPVPLLNSLEPDTEAAINQSLILIEEVDVLYNDDAGFWPAIINIIKECRRPVVLTCNDIHLVPLSDLPLQTTLQFESCPPPLAASYLQASCLSQNFPIDRGDVLRLYSGYPATTETLGLPQRDTCLSDLRFSINQLQYWFSIIPSEPKIPSISATEPFTTGEEAAHQAANSNGNVQNNGQSALCLYDSISFAEDQLSRDPSYLVQHYSGTSSLPDREVGYEVLPLEVLSHPPLASAFYTQDHALSQEVTALSRGTWSGSTGLLNRSRWLSGRLAQDQTNYAGPMHQVLFECLKRWPSLSSESALYTDYLPWIRYMVDADNALEELLSPPSTQSSRRQTRTSRRAGQERHISLESAELELLAKSAFSPER
ncbi:hypothetical protein EUX98_g612 [Antrodiella citrinella]|uniref:ATPase AAA-type core domain-containing protein n=1 Tax=Antrodiella citrinella TaxID=2447956 RepID=A0A4S4N3U0_9APHY|nr:hypothetical protein EUX98_g612 [Antrodiella citrinella]